MPTTQELLPRSFVPPQIPPLEAGDQLSRDEFERRYAAMPHLKKAELIDGVVHMPSPVHWNRHATPHSAINWWLTHYAVHTPGVEVGDNGSCRLDLGGEPQPDVAMIVKPDHGGKVRLSADDFVEGGPDLVTEVAASSVSIDLNRKQAQYARNDVREYIVWRVLDQAIDWFVLKVGQYQRLSSGPDGILRSPRFPGLWLNPASLVGMDLQSVLKVLERGLASPEHAQFIQELQAAATTTPKEAS